MNFQTSSSCVHPCREKLFPFRRPYLALFFPGFPLRPAWASRRTDGDDNAKTIFSYFRALFFRDSWGPFFGERAQNLPQTMVERPKTTTKKRRKNSKTDKLQRNRKKKFFLIPRNEPFAGLTWKVFGGKQVGTTTPSALRLGWIRRHEKQRRKMRMVLLFALRRWWPAIKGIWAVVRLADRVWIWQDQLDWAIDLVGEIRLLEICEISYNFKDILCVLNYKTKLLFKPS